MLRIEFSDGSEIEMLKLLEPIFAEDVLLCVPKLIICQFCRGTLMEQTAFDSSNSDLQSEVNGQESVMINDK